MKTKLSLVVSICLFMSCSRAVAHHGNAEFEMDQTVTLQATITEFVWSNPHSVIYFDAKNEKGQLLRWSCETAQPALLHRAGWTRNSLKPGDHVTVVAHPAKSGQPVGYLIKVVLADGEELKMGNL
jgi:hypothetical protein